MIYLTQPSTPTVRQAMIDHPSLGQLTTPNTGYRIVEKTAWGADNAAFDARRYPGDEKWFRWLAKQPVDALDRCLFAVAPDVVGDHDATWSRSQRWLSRIRDLGMPAAFVAQDGIIESGWDDWSAIDCLFIGGSTGFKLSPQVADLAQVAKGHGKLVHMGRVNSFRRLSYAAHIGCDTTDGTAISIAPTENLDRALRWLDRHTGQPALFTAGDLT